MDPYDALIFESSIRAAASQGALQLPWEHGIIGEICGSDCGWLSKLPCEVAVAPPPPAPVAQNTSAGTKRKRATEQAEVPLYVHAILSVDEKSYAELKELEWTKALAIWLGLHRGSNLQSAVGEHVYDCLCQDDQKGALECLRDVCGTNLARC